MSEKKFVKPDLSTNYDLATEDVFVPKFGGYMRVREMLADERDAYEQSVVAAREEPKKGKAKPPAPFRARLVAKVLVDPENGNRLYADEAAERINKWGAATVDLLFMAAIKLSGMTKEDVEEIEGKSETSPESASG